MLGYEKTINQDGEYVYQFVPEKYVTDRLGVKDIMQLKEVFDTFDIQRSGSINPAEIR